MPTDALVSESILKTALAAGNNSTHPLMVIAMYVAEEI
jgi:hypothetical protein